VKSHALIFYFASGDLRKVNGGLFHSFIYIITKFHACKPSRSTSLGSSKLRSPTALVSLLTRWPPGF